MFRYDRPLLATLFLLAASAVVSGARAEQPMPLQPMPLPPIPYQTAYPRPVLEVVPQPVKDGVAAFESACAGWVAVDDPAYNDPQRLTPGTSRARDLCRLVERPETFMWRYAAAGAGGAIGLLVFAAMLIGMLRVMAFGRSRRPSFPVMGSAMRGQAAS